MTKCPTCHSEIGDGTPGSQQGDQGTDTNGNPVPFWSDDPLLTRGAFNGTSYRGVTKIRGIHIKEIQDVRRQQEIDLGLPEPTFSDVDEETKPTRRHIVELRESTERILNASGVSLEDYFKLDAEGTEQPQNSRVEQTPQAEWVDVERGASYIGNDGQTHTTFVLPDSTTQQSPTLPSAVKVRAIHIEDLRHPVPVGLPSLLVNKSGSLFEGVKDGNATFNDTQACPFFAPDVENSLRPWFTDKDDGTLIGFRPGDDNEVLYDQNAEPYSCVLTSPGLAGTVTFVPALPDDFRFESGSISRFDDRLSLFIEEFTPSRIGVTEDAVGQNEFAPAKTFVTRYDFINREVLGTSSGGANQTLSVSGSEIKTPTKGTPIVFVNGERWASTSSLATAGPNDRVFLYGPSTGTVQFGDGINGAIPQSGTEIVLVITIRDSGGTWEFADIEVEPEAGKHIGGVKSCQDVIVYNRANIAYIDAQKLTSVVSTLDGIQIDYKETTTGELVRREFSYSVIHKTSTFDYSGGEIVLYQTSLEEGLTQELVAYPFPGLYKDPIVTGTYPGAVSMFIETEDVTVISTAEFNVPLFMGGTTSPKPYTSSFTVLPITRVRETIDFVSHPVNGETGPKYQLEWTTRPVSPGGSPLSVARELRTIQLGDESGNWESPIAFGPSISFSKTVPGDSTRHLEWVSMMIEARKTAFQSAYIEQTGGDDIPNFICSWSFNPGTIVAFNEVGV